MGLSSEGGKAQREALRMTYEELTVVKRRTRPDWAPGRETAADDCRCSPGNAAECDAVIEGQIQPPTSANQKHSFADSLRTLEWPRCVRPAVEMSSWHAETVPQTGEYLRIADPLKNGRFLSLSTISWRAELLTLCGMLRR